MRAVIFDVDGVLVHGYHARPELQRRWNETLLADLGVDPERFNAEFIFDVFVKRVIIGQIGLVESLEKVLPRLGYHGSPMRFVSYWLTHDSNLNLPLIDAIRRLKARGDSSLYIATNQEHLRAMWLWQALGLGEVFEDMFYSARIGVVKPQPKFFDFVTRHIGPQDEPPLFFDDRAEIIDAARRKGWEAILFNELADCTTHPWIAARIQ